MAVTLVEGEQIKGFLNEPLFSLAEQQPLLIFSIKKNSLKKHLMFDASYGFVSGNGVTPGMHCALSCLIPEKALLTLSPPPCCSS